MHRLLKNLAPGTHVAGTIQRDFAFQLIVGNAVMSTSLLNP